MARAPALGDAQARAVRRCCEPGPPPSSVCTALACKSQPRWRGLAVCLSVCSVERPAVTVRDRRRLPGRGLGRAAGIRAPAGRTSGPPSLFRTRPRHVGPGCKRGRKPTGVMELPPEGGEGGSRVYLNLLEERTDLENILRKVASSGAFPPPTPGGCPRYRHPGVLGSAVILLQEAGSPHPCWSGGFPNPLAPRPLTSQGPWSQQALADLK